MYIVSFQLMSASDGYLMFSAIGRSCPSTSVERISSSNLRQQKIRIGTMDLKIASIALVNDALLITANIRDFSLVPGLRCENWLEL